MEDAIVAGETRTPLPGADWLDRVYADAGILAKARRRLEQTRLGAPPRMWAFFEGLDSVALRISDSHGVLAVSVSGEVDPVQAGELGRVLLEFADDPAGFAAKLLREEAAALSSVEGFAGRRSRERAYGLLDEARMLEEERDTP